MRVTSAIAVAATCIETCEANRPCSSLCSSSVSVHPITQLEAASCTVGRAVSSSSLFGKALPASSSSRRNEAAAGCMFSE